jgi:hypothetical protein
MATTKKKRGPKVSETLMEAIEEGILDLQDLASQCNELLERIECTRDQLQEDITEAGVAWDDVKRFAPALTKESPFAILDLPDDLLTTIKKHLSK